MDLSVVFNEICLRISASTKDQARDWMNIFVDALTAANDAGLKTLRTHADFKELILSPDYPMVAWYNDGLVPLEKRDYLLTYASRYPVIKPHIQDLDEEHSVRKRSDNGFTGGYEGAEALGLSFAFMLDAIAISILTEDVWDNFEIEFDRMEEIDDDITEDKVKVKHISRALHIATHQTWISDYYENLILDGVSLIQHGSFMYPDIVFCGKSVTQIHALGANDQYFKMLKNELDNMQRYCTEWDDNYFNASKYGGRTNTESEATLNQYGYQRRFLIPGKGHQTFSWHTRLDRNWRIHFFPVPAERKIYVGYVGKHLDISTG